MVADACANPGIEHAKFFEHWQKQAAQCDLARRDENRARLQILALGYLFFARLDVLDGDLDVLIQLLTLRRQAHAAVCARKQGAAELAFEVLYRPCQIGLVVQKQLRGL